MELSNKLIYVIIGLLVLSFASNVLGLGKDLFFPQERTYSKEAVELMLKHDRLKQENERLKLENEIIEKDNERIKQDITADSTVIYNSSRAYRDSLRAELFR